MPVPTVHTLVHADTPPSLNKLLYANWQKQRRIKKGWQQLFEGLLMLNQVPKSKPGRRIHASAKLTFPVERRRDEDNYKSILSKCLADALVNGGWLEDDTPQFFSFGKVEFAEELGPRKIEVTLELFG